MNIADIVNISTLPIFLGEKMVDVVTIELDSLKDLIKLACSVGFHVLYRTRAEEDSIYLLIYGLGSTIIVPYVKTDQKLEGEYVIYNTSTGDIKTSKTLTVEPREIALALITIKKQELIRVFNRPS